MQVYHSSAELINAPGFELKPDTSFASDKKFVITLPARSITTVSGYNLMSVDKDVF